MPKVTGERPAHLAFWVICSVLFFMGITLGKCSTTRCPETVHTIRAAHLVYQRAMVETLTHIVVGTPEAIAPISEEEFTRQTLEEVE